VFSDENDLAQPGKTWGGGVMGPVDGRVMLESRIGAENFGILAREGEGCYEKVLTEKEGKFKVFH
jgi:hypothetical protein